MTGFQKCIKVGAIVFGTYLSAIIIGIIIIIMLSFVGFFVAISGDNWIFDEKSHYEEYRDDDYYEDIIYKDFDDRYYEGFTNQL